MRLTVLGSGTCVPSLQRGASGILLQAGGKNIVVDMGLGTLHKLLQLGITYSDIDLLCLTHIHPDHVSELIPFLFACKYGEVKRERDLILVGGEGFNAFLQSLSTVFQHWLTPDQFRLETKELPSGSFSMKEIKIETGPVKHSKESVAYRITSEGKSVVVSGDTGYCPEIVNFSKGADLLVLECSSPKKYEVDTHLNPSSAGKIAVESGCRKLLLTHFYPVCESVDLASECREVYQGELLLAQDLMELEV